jgi:hypothetical protein
LDTNKQDQIVEKTKVKLVLDHDANIVDNFEKFEVRLEIKAFYLELKKLIFYRLGNGKKIFAKFMMKQIRRFCLKIAKNMRKLI